jgi:hypothetical protein
MAAQNVNNNISNIERKIMGSPKHEERDQLPLLGAAVEAAKRG